MRLVHRVIDWVWSSTRVSQLVRRLTTPKGRIGFNCLRRLFWNGSFASGCSPPCLTASQLPSATRSHVRFVLRFALVSLISITNARTAPVLWRFGNDRELDGIQNSLAGSSNCEAKSGRGQPQSTTLPRVIEAWEVRQPLALDETPIFPFLGCQLCPLDGPGFQPMPVRRAIPGPLAQAGMDRAFGASRIGRVFVETAHLALSWGGLLRLVSTSSWLLASLILPSLLLFHFGWSVGCRDRIGRGRFPAGVHVEAGPGFFQLLHRVGRDLGLPEVERTEVAQIGQGG